MPRIRARLVWLIPQGEIFVLFCELLGLAKQYLPISASHLQATLSRSSLAKSSTWALRRLRLCSLRSTQSGPNQGANSGRLLFLEPLLQICEGAADQYRVVITTQLMMQGVLLLGLIVAGISDVRSSRVPNILTFSLALTGLGFHSIADSGSGFLFSVEGFGLGLVLLLGFYMYGGMGAGDVKLLAAVGAVVGPQNVFVGFLFTALFGGLYAVALMVWHVGLARTAERIKVILVSMVFMRVNVTDSLGETTLPKLRYALVIGLGTLMGEGYLWFHVH